MLTQRLVAKIFGYTFVAVGLLAFIPNPIVGENALFQTNLLHDMVHLLSGVVALAVGYSKREDYAKTYNMTFGFVYAAVTLLGFLGVGFVVNLLVLNMADNILHLLITAGLLGAAFGIPAMESRPSY